MTRKPIVGGNWKCNPASPGALTKLIANINACDTSACEVYVCPSPLHVGMVYDKFTNGAKVAPQNCNFKVHPPARRCAGHRHASLSRPGRRTGLRRVHRRDGG